MRVDDLASTIGFQCSFEFRQLEPPRRPRHQVHQVVAMGRWLGGSILRSIIEMSDVSIATHGCIRSFLKKIEPQSHSDNFGSGCGYELGVPGALASLVVQVDGTRSCTESQSSRHTNQGQPLTCASTAAPQQAAPAAALHTASWCPPTLLRVPIPRSPHHSTEYQPPMPPEYRHDQVATARPLHLA